VSLKKVLNSIIDTLAFVVTLILLLATSIIAMSLFIILSGVSILISPLLLVIFYFVERKNKCKWSSEERLTTADSAS